MNFPWRVSFLQIGPGKAQISGGTLAGTDASRLLSKGEINDPQAKLQIAHFWGKECGKTQDPNSDPLLVSAVDTQILLGGWWHFLHAVTESLPHWCKAVPHGP